MKYVPGLIPKNSKVLPEYFKGHTYGQADVKSNAIIFSYIASIILFIISIVALAHPLLSLLILVPALCLFPPIHVWIENTGRFKFTPKIKGGFLLVFLLIIIPVAGHYNSIDKEEAIIEALQKKERLEKEEKIALINKENNRKRRDSLNVYISQVEHLKESKKTEKALHALEIANSFAQEKTEKQIVRNLKGEILQQEALDFVKIGKYEKAITGLNNLLADGFSSKDLIYNRGLCLSKTGRIKEAVEDLRKAIELGDNRAEKLYEKVNPVKKTVVGYVTRCCDGTTSNSTGRGTCSHHGGVCDWSEPVYEESRKY